jgi:hypothetical protein
LFVITLFVASVLTLTNLWVGRSRSRRIVLANSFAALFLAMALAGLGGFFWAIQLFRGNAISADSARRMADLIQQNQVGPALEILFRAFSQEEAIVAGVIMLASVLILSWPPRKRVPAFGPLPNQGVVL